jgi:hypothetical protein
LAAQHSNYLTGQLTDWADYLREIDDQMLFNGTTFLHNVAVGLKNSTEIQTTGLTPYHAGYDSVAGTWVVVGDDGASNGIVKVADGARVINTPTMPTSNIIQLETIAEDGAGTLLTAGTVSSGPEQYFRSTDGGFTWVTLTDVISGNQPRILRYFNGRFISLSSTFPATATARYSTNGGTTWSAATLPTPGSWSGSRRGGDATDGVVLVAADFTVNSSKLFTTTDGITWVARTVPAAGAGGWVSVTWTPTWGWLAWDSALQAGPIESSDGIGWGAATTAVAPAGATGIAGSFAIYDLIVLCWSDASFDYVSYSRDGGATWVPVTKNTISPVLRPGWGAVGDGRFAAVGSSFDKSISLSDKA